MVLHAVIREGFMVRKEIEGIKSVGNDGSRLPIELAVHTGTTPMYASAIGGAATGFLITLFPCKLHVHVDHLDIKDFWARVNWKVLGRSFSQYFQNYKDLLRSPQP